MQYCIDARTNLKWITLGVVLSGVLYAQPVAALQATGSNVEVMVCPTANESSFMVNEPQNDTIVNIPKVQLGGDVTFISQIDFFIDDVYNHTIALGRSAIDFESSMTLSPGTHTLKFVATDSCSQTVHVTSLVMTYEPTTQPSNGRDVVTEVDNRVTAPLNITQPQPPENILEKGIDTLITPPVKAVADALNLTPPDVETPASAVMNTARAVLFLTGTTLALAAVHIGSLTVLPESLKFMNRFRWSGTSVVALIGMFMVVLVFML